MLIPEISSRRGCMGLLQHISEIGEEQRTKCVSEPMPGIRLYSAGLYEPFALILLGLNCDGGGTQEAPLWGK